MSRTSQSQASSHADDSKICDIMRTFSSSLRDCHFRPCASSNSTRSSVSMFSTTYSQDIKSPLFPFRRPCYDCVSILSTKHPQNIKFRLFPFQGPRNEYPSPSFLQLDPCQLDPTHVNRTCSSSLAKSMHGLYVCVRSPFFPQR